MRFADCARAAAGIACGRLGWRADDFWAATPADLAVVAEALRPEADAALGAAELFQMMERDAHG